MHLNYFVLYVSDLDASRDWYGSALGLRFTRERHNGGPVHYSTEIDGTVLELYPATGDRPRSRVRIGVSVRDPFRKRPAPTTITDPDGNVIAIEASVSDG